MTIIRTVSSPLRVLVGGYTHELNSFIPGTTSIEAMAAIGHHVVGEQMFSEEHIGTGQELNAVIDRARAEGVELVPSLHVWGGAGPILTRQAFEYIREGIVAALEANAGRLDGIFLALHGSTACIGIDDTEGELLTELRARVGPDLPIVATFDFHAHLTQRMASAANGLFGEQTCPHTDYYESGVRAFDALLGAMRGMLRPVTRFRKLQMITSAERHDTNEPPMADVMAEALRQQARPGVLCVTVFATQPWMDVAELGWSVCVVTDGDAELAQEVADTVAGLAWERREAFMVHKTPVAEAVRQAIDAPRGPVILADGADTTTGGGEGDGNEILREILASGTTETAIAALVDPAAVSACFEAGIGGQLELSLGGALSPRYFTPLRASGMVITLADGLYMMEFPERPRHVGRIAVFQIGSVSVVLTDRKPEHLGAGLYRRAGLDPMTAKVIVVKSAGGFKFGYRDIAAEIIEVATRGPCTSTLTDLPFTNITRPLWPFDPELTQPWR